MFDEYGQFIGWGGPASAGFGGTQPPQYILDAMGGSYDQSQYYWDPMRMALVDRYTGGSYGFGDIADPSLGTDVVTNLSDYNATGQAQLHYGAGQNPYFGFGDSAQGYNGGDAPNSGMFISADPNAISDYQSHRSDVVDRGIASVAALVGGTALGGALSGGAAPPAYTGATTAAGLPTGAAAAAGGGVGTLAGAVPAVGASPGLVAGLGAAGATNALTGSGGSVLDSSGSAIPGTDLSGLGGAVGGNFLENWLPYITGGINTLLGNQAAGKASDAEIAAYQAAIDEQRRQYDTTRADLQPWMTAGQGALNRLQDPNAFQASPGYQWARSEGQRDIGNSFAARGGAASGNALKALSEFNTGLAQQDYGNWWNQQAGLAGVGQTAGTNLGQFGQQSAANTGNYLAGQGASRASGVLGKYGSLAQGLNDGVSNWLYRRRGG
jgi:hypothetical protein